MHCREDCHSEDIDFTSDEISRLPGNNYDIVTYWSYWKCKNCGSSGQCPDNPHIEHDYHSEILTDSPLESPARFGT